jgi:hypothetical protein
LNSSVLIVSDQLERVCLLQVYRRSHKRKSTNYDFADEQNWDFNLRRSNLPLATHADKTGGLVA